MSAGVAGVAEAPAEAYFRMCGDWREETVAIHGPNGHIASGLTSDQATPIIDELNRLHELTQSLSQYNGR